MSWSHAVSIEQALEDKLNRQPSPAQHSTAQHSTAQHSTAQRSHLTRPDFLHSEANFSHVWVSSAIGSTSVRTDRRACHTSTFL